MDTILLKFFENSWISNDNILPYMVQRSEHSVFPTEVPRYHQNFLLVAWVLYLAAIHGATAPWCCNDNICIKHTYHIIWLFPGLESTRFLLTFKLFIKGLTKMKLWRSLSSVYFHNGRVLKYYRNSWLSRSRNLILISKESNSYYILPWKKKR